jgi:hydrogenase nickel incorporation protein HypA/HybF
MHEFGLMEDVVRHALDVVEREGAGPATRVLLEVGEYARASRASLEAAFDVLTRGTAIEGARMEIVDIPARLRCEACGLEGTPEKLEVEADPALLLCPDCGGLLSVTQGGGVVLKAVVTEVPA